MVATIGAAGQGATDSPCNGYIGAVVVGAGGVEKRARASGAGGCLGP